MTDKEIYTPLENITIEQAYEDYAKAAEEMKDTLLDEIDKLHKQIEHLQGEREALLEDIHHSADQINKQIEEIEVLKMVVEQIEDHINPLPFETDYAKAIRQAKAEAIKEFADRLKEHLKGNGSLYCATTMNAKIDNLVKEMVGEDK